MIETYHAALFGFQSNFLLIIGRDTDDQLRFESPVPFQLADLSSVLQGGIRRARVY